MAETGTVLDAATEVVINTRDLQNPRFTPRELRAIKERFGRPLSAILGDEDSDDKFLAFGWLKLRREGRPLDWDQMDDVVMSFDVETAAVRPDPTNGQPPTT